MINSFIAYKDASYIKGSVVQNLKAYEHIRHIPLINETRDLGDELNSFRHSFAHWLVIYGNNWYRCIYAIHTFADEMQPKIKSSCSDLGMWGWYTYPPHRVYHGHIYTYKCGTNRQGCWLIKNCFIWLSKRWSVWYNYRTMATQAWWSKKYFLLHSTNV